MGFATFGCGGGRVDSWQLEADIDWGNDWGNETTWLADGRDGGDRELEQPLAAAQMGLIDVNPEALNGVPDPVASGRDLRETFARMASNDGDPVGDFVMAWSKVLNFDRFDCLPDCLLDCKPD